MKKHLFGFAVFSLIVGSAIFVSSIFSAPKNVFVHVIETTGPHTPKTSCWARKRESVKTGSVSIKQAVLDLETKEIKFQLDVPKLDSPVALHFFTKDSEGTIYLATEFPFPVISNASGQHGVVKSNSWMKDLDGHQNLYVVAEHLSRRNFELGVSNPEFDETKAVAVTVNSRKAFYKTLRK